MSMTVLRAFSEDMVSKLTGLSTGQLRSWDRSGLFVPSLADDNRRLPYSRAYSFMDLASLRVISTLKFEHGVSTQHLKKAARRLKELGRDDWASQSIYVLKKEVVFENDGRLEVAATGQGVLKIPLKVAFQSVQKDVDALFRRDKSKVGHLSKTRHIMGGEEVVAGTRIPIRSIRSYIDMGLSDQRILTDYPDLKQADIDVVRKAYRDSAA